MLAIATAMITISSKFLLRWRGKHLFNPTNFGLVFMLIFAQGAVWVSLGNGAVLHSLPSW
jgi:Na+-transporting NADH:ubiquinone oxidoreductase subunit NqrB